MFNLRRTPFSSMTGYRPLASPSLRYSINIAAKHTVGHRLDLGG